MTWIRPYSPAWPAAFDRIEAHLLPVLPPAALVHHVGSTSVPGMPAKDIIDLDIECARGESSALIGALAGIGYLHEGNLGIPGREALKALPDTPAGALPPHHLYVCESGASELARHLAYRDYLRAHPERAAWLAERKIACDRDAVSRADYIERKVPYYAVIVGEAVAWRSLDEVVR